VIVSAGLTPFVLWAEEKLLQGVPKMRFEEVWYKTLYTWLFNEVWYKIL
jgi:hypothetical protein